MVVKQIEGIGHDIMTQRYLYPGEKTWGDRARVIARTIARAEKDDEKPKWERKFFDTISSGDLVPGGRIIYGSGRSRQNLLNCFSDDTLVFTETGFKKITEVNIGDCVLTHKNRFRPVVNKFPQGVREKLLQIKLYNYNDSFALKVTPDHKIMTPNGYVEAASLKRGDMVNIPALDGIITPTTIKISDFVDSKYVVEGDVIGLPCKMNGKKHPKGGIIGKWNGKTCNNVIPINIDFGLWIGYFLSEGCAPAHKNGIKFTFNSKEIDYIQDVVKLGKSIFGVDGSISPSKAGEWTDVIFNSRILNEFHRNYLGDKFNTKILPWYFVSNEIDPEIQKEILVGLFRGDGSPYNRERSKATVLTLANPTLVFQAHMISNVLKLHSSFTYNPRVKKETHSVQGSLRLFSTTVNYELYNQIYGTNYTSDVRYGMIQEITEIPYGREVWDISVEEDHSLVANGIVASNCYQVSPDDNVNSIAKLLSDVYKISCGGGGIGFSFSNIRPKGDDIQNIPNSAPGAVSVIKMINAIGDQVKAGKNRRTALLASLSVRHPDILDFLHVKLDKKELNNFNISVEIDDEFLQACNGDEEWSFRYNNKDYYVYQVERFNVRRKTRETINIVALSSEDALGRGVNHYLVNGDDQFENAVRYPLRAKELWNNIWTNAVEAGCPGILNMGFANSYTNVSYFEKLMSTNPCVAKGTLVNTPLGYRKVEDLKVGDLISTVLGSEPIKTIEVNENVMTYKVTFSDGGEQFVTGSHIYHVLNGDKKAKLIPLSEVKSGDYVRILPTKFSTNLGTRTYYDGLKLGILLGDGSLINESNLRISSSIDDVDYNACVKNLFGAKNFRADYQHRRDSKSMNINFTSEASRLVHQELGIPKEYCESKYIPNEYLTNVNSIIGVLDGLLATDGNILYKVDNPMVRITTTSKELAQGLRRALLYCGIHAKVYSSFNDDGGVINGRKIERKNRRYDIHIFGDGLKSYFEQTRLKDIHPSKYAKLKDIYINCNLTGELWKSEVISIEEHKLDTVYDLYCEDSDTWITEGYVQRGCGEQTLPNYGNCCLGNINLSNMVKDNDVDWPRLATAVRTGIRFLDNVLTENYFPIEECREVGHKSRRIGLGVMGLHYMLIKLNLRYGSEKCLEFLERLFSTIRNEAYLASIYLAEEKGSFPAFDVNKFLNEEFAKTLPPRIRMLIKQKGIRNAVLLTCPPTGTISMVMGTSTGIEPIFAPIYKRRYRKGNAWAEEIIVDPLLKEFFLAGTEFSRLKDIFVGAYDVTPSEHMAVQATIQKFIDSALSKTINLPSTATAEEFSDTALIYASTLKGLTVYREGSKENAPLVPIELTEEVLKSYVNTDVQTQVSDGAACTIGSGECGA